MFVHRWDKLSKELGKLCNEKLNGLFSCSDTVRLILDLGI